MNVLLCGTGSSVPKHFVDNRMLSERVETSDEWIRERTGIERRHIAETETVVSMAVEAGKKAVESAGCTPHEIDLILVSTFSGEAVLPCIACEVQAAIGAEKAVCFDLNAACAGFLTACQTADAYLNSGMCRTVLIIGSERLSRLVDWTDRSTCILFGDGAGAAVLKAGAGKHLFSAIHADGRKGFVLSCSTGGYMKMDGQEVFKFAVKRVPEVILETLEKNEMSKEEIDCYILHQANRRILEAVARRMEEPIEKFPMNLQEYGNTSSASIPLLLDEMKQQGKLKAGQKVLLAGFGAGLIWGAFILECA